MRLNLSFQNEISLDSGGYTKQRNFLHQANQLCIQTLLNCYCREVATPNNLLSFVSPKDLKNCPEDLLIPREESGAHVLLIQLPFSNLQIAVKTASWMSLTGTYEFCGPCFYQDVKTCWHRLNGLTLAYLIETELSGSYDTPFNGDFLASIENSLQMTELITHRNDHLFQHPITFIEAEQSLTFGHPFHPNPKSRTGFSLNDAKRYSPECKANFPLHYFAIRREYLIQDSLTSKDTASLIQEEGPLKIKLDSDFALIPTHPWQAKNLLGFSEVQIALRQDQIRDLGISGPHYYPTASIRTLYCPDNPYFYKMSLHARITNCIRRNTLVELQSSLEVSRLLHLLTPDWQLRYPQMTFLDEPAFLTVSFDPKDTVAHQKITESFGMMLRKNFDKATASEHSPIVTAYLFGNRELGRTFIKNTIPWSMKPEDWFTYYIEQFVPPLLSLFFEQGIMLEPHLQNTLITLKEGLPSQFFIRDFDNVRIISGTPAEKLLKTARQKVHEELLYTETQGWNRFFYCLVVNHLCEAIYHLSYNDRTLETKLWGHLKAILLEYASSSLDNHIQSQIDQVLHGKTLPAKGNLITRFQNLTDRKATYLELPNPFNLNQKIL